MKTTTKKSTKLLILGSVLLISLLSGCKKQKKVVTINIKNPLNAMSCIVDPEIAEDQDFLKKAWNAFAAQYTKYDVNADFYLFRQEELVSNITECYDTPQAADVLMGGYVNMISFMHEGRVVPLDSIITPEMMADFDKAVLDMGKASNGKIYMLPFTVFQNILCYNKTLFAQCGLEKYISDEPEIQNWTLDQWEEVLSTLQKNLPQNYYPMMMYAASYMGDAHTMLQLRVKGSNFFDEKGRFNLNTPEGIAALEWIKSNKDKGYYPFDCENSTIGDCASLFCNGKLAIHLWNTALEEGYPENFERGFVNFPSSKDEGVADCFINGFTVFDNGDPAKLEVAKDFVAFIYHTPKWLEYSAGDLPCSKSVAQKYADKIYMGTMLAPNNKNIVDYQANNPNWLKVRNEFFPEISKFLKGSQTAEQTAQMLDKKCNAAIEEGYKTSKLHE